MDHCRVDVRISLDSDECSRVRNTIAPMLEAVGIHNQPTGEWHGDDVPMSALARQLANVFHVLADPHGQVTNPNLDVAVDHVWIHVCRVP